MKPTDEPRRVAVRIDVSVRSAIIVVSAGAALWLFTQLWQILLVIVVALMVAGMLNPFVERFERRGLRRGQSIAIVFGAVFLAVGGVLALMIPRLVSQLSTLVLHFPEAQARLATQLQGSSLTAPLAGPARSLHLEEMLGKAKDYVIAYGPQTAEAIAYAVTAWFLALYIIIDRDRLRGAFFALVPRSFHLRLSRVLMNLEIIVGGYMRGQAITSLAMSGFTFTVLTVAGAPNALPLALFAGIADVLPYVGGLLACGPAVLAALSQGPTTALVVLGLLVAYQQFESRIIIPRIYGQVLRLPAAVVMVSLLVGGKLLGILGALLALPIAAGIRMVIEELRVELPGEDIDDTAIREKDARSEAEFEARADGVPATEAAAIAAEIAHDRLEEEMAESGKDAGESALEPITSGEAAK